MILLYKYQVKNNLMKKFILFLILPFLISLTYFSFGQTASNDLLLIEINDKFGYINKSGEIVIEPQFKYANSFSEGLAVISMPDEDEAYGGKYGYIDSTGTLIISPKYNTASNFTHGWARVKQEFGGFIYINKLGKPMMNNTFFECYNVHNFPIPVRETRKSKAGYIDKKGTYVIEAKFDVAFPFIEGYAVVAMNQKYGYINLQGVFLIQPKFYRANYFQNGLAKVIIQDEKSGDKREGFINKKGKYIVPPSFCVGCAKDFSEGLAAVTSDGKKWGFINTNGKIVIAAQFEKATIFKEGLAKVKFNGKYGFIDKSGNWIIKPKYDNVSNFNNGIASIYQKNERMGYIDKHEKYIWRAKKPKKKEMEESPYDKY
ncbi:MAG: hypothetical protein ACJAUH_001067 [Saprospiraceae bacterium]|jgi:hypothetical protein